MSFNGRRISDQRKRVPSSAEPIRKTSGILSFFRRFQAVRTRQRERVPINIRNFAGIANKKKSFVRQPNVTQFSAIPRPFQKLTQSNAPTPARNIFERITTARSQVLSRPAGTRANATNAVIGSRRKLTGAELAQANKAAPRAVNPNKVRLANRQTPRIDPQLTKGRKFGGIGAAGGNGLQLRRGSSGRI